MTTTEKAIEILQGIITTIDAKQWKEIKEQTAPEEILRVAMESQGLQRVEKEIRILIQEAAKNERD